jgi:hypothetical protein
MCIDSKKFLATADGRGIRLFPENYNILTRHKSKGPWVIDIDPAVPEALAVEVFKAWRKGHLVKWGAKNTVLETLNALLPKDTGGDPEHETAWSLSGVYQRQHIWSRFVRGIEIYNVTPTAAPPQGKSGYLDIEFLLEMKGIPSGFL